MSKHSWTEQELRIVCVCYKENLPIDLALRLTNTTNVKSMNCRYQNCLFLDKGHIENSLSHPSKTHVKVWNEVSKMYDNKQQQEDNKIYYFVIAFISIFTLLNICRMIFG